MNSVMKISSVKRFAATLAMTFLASAASAATLYVDSTHGSDGDINNPATCKKSAPCQTIQKALDVGGSNTRVLVAPGVYFGDINVTNDRVTIQSVSGKEATTITNSSARIIDVAADRFTLGGKGKGFRIETLFDGTRQEGLLVIGDQAKIEHNDFLGFDGGSFPQTGTAVALFGSRATFRYNEIQGFGGGFNALVAAGVNSNHIVEENSIGGVGSQCIAISGAGRSRDRVRNNVIGPCESNGARFFGISLAYSVPSTARPDVRNNHIDGTLTGIVIQSARPSVSNNLISFAGTAIGLFNTSGASVRDNFIRNSNTSLGQTFGLRIVSPSGSRSTISGNEFRQVDTALDLENVAERLYNTISKNNFSLFSAGDDCVIRIDSPTPGSTIKFSGNFWGDDRLPEEDGPARPLSPGFTCSVGNFSDAVAAELVTFTRSSDIPLLSRYKGQQP